MSLPLTLPTQTGQKLLTMPSLKPRLTSYLSDPRIDWSGNICFREDGSIDLERSSRTGTALNFSAIPLPVVPQESEEYRNLKEAVRHLEEMLLPAPAEQVLLELKALSGFCIMVNRNAMDFELMLQQYLRDLADYPLDLIARACERYRNDPDPKNDGFPRPGKLKALVNHEYYHRKHTYTRLSKLLERADNPPPPPAPMTVQEKQERKEARQKIGEIIGGFQKKNPAKSQQEKQAEHVHSVRRTVEEMVAGGMIPNEQAVAMLSKLRSSNPTVADAELDRLIAHYNSARE